MLKNALLRGLKEWNYEKAYLMNTYLAAQDTYKV
jgi:hypothetical protein